MGAELTGWAGRCAGIRPAVVFASIAILATLPAAGQQASERWAPAIAAFEAQDREQPPQPGGTMFLGSSSIRFWDLERWFPASRFPGLRATNRGFGGSQIADSLRYLDRIVWPHRPSTIVFYAGDNDIAAGKSAQAVAADFAELGRRVWAELPETRFIYVAIKPSLARWHLAPEMRAANALIEASAKRGAAPPVWQWQDVLHMKPGDGLPISWRAGPTSTSAAWVSPARRTRPRPRRSGAGRRTTWYRPRTS